MKVLVMGAGAVGCYYGAMLARAGHAVTLVARARHVEIVQRDGLMLESSHFSGRVPMRAVAAPDRAVADTDLVLFCVKSGDTETAGHALAPYVKPDAMVLSLQNGVDNAERLARVMDRPVVPAVVYVAVEMAGPGHVKHHGRGELLIGASAQSPQVAALLTAAEVPTTVSPNVVSALWDKLIINCAFNALSAIPHMPYGDLFRHPGVSDVMTDVVNECLAVADAAGIAVDKDIHAAVRQIAQSMSTQYSSTAQDLRAGKRSEIDHLNGYVVARGADLQVPTPVNRSLHTMVRLMETSRAAGGTS